MKKNRARLRRIWSQYRKDTAFFRKYAIETPCNGYTNYADGMRQKLLALATVKMLRGYGIPCNVPLPSIADLSDFDMDEDDTVWSLDDTFCMVEDAVFGSFINLMGKFGWRWTSIPSDSCHLQDIGKVITDLGYAGALAEDVAKGIEYICEDSRECGELRLNILMNPDAGRMVSYAKMDPEFKNSKIFKRLCGIKDFCSVPLEYYHSDPCFNGVQDGVYYSIFSTGYNAGWDTFCDFRSTLVSAPIYAMYFEKVFRVAERMYPGLGNWNPVEKEVAL